MQKSVILPLFYLAPVAYYSNFKAGFETLILEKEEHFPKQTFRNRCSLYSANGQLDLTVPVQRGAKVHTAYKDVKISYDFDWQRLHWLSLQTCYRSSAYFEYYEDELRPFYTQKPEFLFDLNEALLDWSLKKLKLQASYHVNKEYVKSYDADTLDLRYTMPCKTPSVLKPNLSYYQVFEDRHGFIPNLSILDLLFNQGPQAKTYI